VQCCVTSPPYWGLRDYGVAGALGLEETPEAYVANLVAVFREVWRVLRLDGTLWLNLSSSYASGGNATSQSLLRRNASAYGSDDKEQPNFQTVDSACSDLCDECRVAIESRSRRNSGNDQLSGRSERRVDAISRDNTHVFESPASEVCDVPESTNLESSEQPQGECLHCTNCGACLNVLASASRDARLCARKASRNSDILQRGLERRIQGKDALGSAYSTIVFPRFKPKDMIPVPWLVALALQAEGWYLRSDIIWHKPNPMPESVTDRPTKAHEYIFLFAKAERYFYDADAIREPHIEPWRGGGEHESTNPHSGGNLQTGVFWVPNKRQYNPLGRNKRTVWTIATQSYSEAHFATFPEELPKLCILAGSKPGDTILDPFAGSGTTGKVALELGRQGILIELNPAYIALARERTAVTAGWF